MDLAPVETAVGPCEVDELEDAQVRVDLVGRDERHGAHAACVYDDELAWLNLSLEGGTHYV